MPHHQTYDVLVSGGGFAGAAAAISSARRGIKTALIERYGFLGGLATAGLVNPFMTHRTSTGEPLIAGIFDELRERLDRLGGIIQGTFDAEIMKFTLQEMLLESGADLFLHCWVTGVETDGPIIRSLAVQGKDGVKTLKAACFVDTTGDGDIAAMAGAPWEMGGADGHPQSMTLMFDIGGVDFKEAISYVKDHPDQMLFPKLAPESDVDAIADGVISVAGYYDLVKQAKDRGEFDLPGDLVFFISRPRTAEVVVNTTHIGEVDGTDPDDLTKAEMETRKQTQCLMKFFKSCVPGFKRCFLLRMAPQIGIRETRRITGEYVFSADDVIEARKFTDAIARLAYPVDVHSAKGYTKDELEPRPARPNVPPPGDWYEIPYRSLVPLGVDNLLIAGRCASATHEGQGAIRIMPCCAAMGQAAGTAAAISVGTGASPRSIDTSFLINELRKQGALV